MSKIDDVRALIAAMDAINRERALTDNEADELHAAVKWLMHAEAVQRYRKANPEKRRAWAESYRLRHPDRVNARQRRQWANLPPEKRAARIAQINERRRGK